MSERHPLSTYQTISVGVRTHRLPPETVTAALREDMDEHTEGAWFAVILHADGSGFLRGKGEMTEPPPSEPLERMIDLALMLNRDVHQGGHWIVAWANHRITVLWRDRDGDLQFTQEFDEPWPRLQAWPTIEFAERAALAWDRWKEHMRRQQFDQRQMYRRAQGEAAPAVRLS